MPEQIVSTTPASSAPVDAKQTANNIAKGISERANGKTVEIEKQSDQTSTPTDPNAGKEKIVVNGQEVWVTPEQLRALAQKGLAFEPKVTQLAKLDKETRLFLDKLKNDPAAILFDKRIGLTPETVFEKVMASAKINDDLKERVGRWYYDNVIEPGRMTPEQLKAREDAKFRQEREEHDKRQLDMAVERENQMKVEMTMQAIRANIGEAMKDSGLPNNDSPLGAMMARRVADIMRLAYFQNTTVTPKAAIEKVKSEMKSLTSAYYDHLDEDKIVAELGEKNAEKVKKYFLKLAKDSENKIPGIRNGKRPEADQKFKTRDDVLDYFESLKKQ